VPLDATTVRTAVDDRWEGDVLGPLQDYVAIPNVSPAFDADWEANGHMARATALVRDWCAARPIEGMAVEVHELPGRTPVVLCEIPATDPDLAGDTVLLYGHLDKQPEMTGWRGGLGPWTPVLDGDVLYGRGGADDGYSAFSALVAVEALREAGGRHARLLLLIEASEESGSPDLPAHLEALGDRLGQVSLVIGLDSGCATYDRLWATTSLRGMLIAGVRVDVLTEGVHSGSAGGVVPDSFRVLRRLLDRVEDPDTGRVLVPEMAGPLPPEREAQLAAGAEEIVGSLGMPWAGGTQPVHDDPVDLLRARTWDASITTIAMDGFPPADRAGNVLRPHTEALLSCRLGPLADPDAAAEALERALAADPPHGAGVTVTVRGAEAGWAAPPTTAWLQDALDEASTQHWGRPSATLGEGGTIPFMGMLGARFPDAQFLITGVLGPGSNAHGPNEALHLPTARRVTATVAHVLDAHARR